MLSMLPLQANGQEPDIIVDPTSGESGHVAIGNYNDMWFNVANSGDPGSTLEITSTTITGPNAGDFSIESGGAPPTISLQPGDGHGIQVRFTPSDVGDRTATLTLAHNVGGGTLDISLHGYGRAPGPDIVVDPTSWDYGNVRVWDQPCDWFDVSNPGTEWLSVSLTTITGPDADDFTIGEGGGGFGLWSWQEYGMEVCFRPSSPGPKSATLNFYTNVPGKNPLEVALSGNGVQSQIAVSPDPGDFGDVEVLGGIYREMTFTVSNPGDASLDVWDIHLWNDNHFSIVSGGGNFSLEPGETHDIVVRFTPQHEGSHNGTLWLNTNVPDVGWKSVELQGNGISSHWSIWLNACVPGTCIESYVGAHPDATHGFDNNPGQGWDAPLPPRGSSPISLDACLELPGAAPGSLESRLSRDLRADVPHADFDQTYIFHAYSDEAEFSICWHENFHLPGDLYAVMTQVDPAGPSVNMREHHCFPGSFSPGAEYTFHIRIRELVEVAIQFFKGWNMISVPGIPDPPINISDWVDGTPVSPDAYTWDPAIPDYVSPTTLEFGPAYWFYSDDDCELTLECRPRYRLEREVFAGWNMVGNIYEGMPVSGLRSDPSGNVTEWVYSWNPGQGYVLEQHLSQTEGHWVAVLDHCTLIMDPTLPAPPAPQLQPIVAKPSWESVIAIQTQGQHQELAFGMHPSASGGLDRLLDRPHPPLPVWADDSLSAGWMVEDTLFSMLDKSFVADSSRAIWELSVQLPESGELQWQNLPTEYRCLLWYDGQVIRMQDETAMSLPAGSHKLRLVLDSFESLPERTEVLPNYPNPANPETWIPYRLAEDGDVTLVIYDTSGREIRRFHLYNQFAGEYKDKDHAIHWDGRNQSGEAVSSGVYFYSLQTAGASSQTGKLVIIR